MPCRTSYNVTDSQITHEAMPFVESMYVRLLSPALQHNVEASLSPGRLESSLYYRASVTPAYIIVMGYDIFKEAVFPAFTKQVWNGYQHAGGNDS